MAKISVIVPIYGVEQYIERCVRSLFRQTLSDIEFIFIDDCTKDDSISILNKLIEDNRTVIMNKGWKVRVESMPSNSGLPAVRKYGVSLSEGDYIAHCDSDDWVEPSMYQLLYEKAIEKNYDIVWCGYYRTDGKSFIKKTDNRQRFLMQGPVWNKIIKRTVYTDNFIVYPISSKAEDGALMTQLSFFSKSRYYIDQPLYNYFINDKSICGQIDENSCIRKLEQEKLNVQLREDFLRREEVIEKYDIDIIMWKYAARENLKPLLNQTKYLRLWRETYPEINKPFILDRRISLRTKLAFIKRYLGIF